MKKTKPKASEKELSASLIGLLIFAGICSIVAIAVGAKYLFDGLCVKTNSPFWILLDVLCSSLSIALIIFIVVFYTYFFITSSKKEKEASLKMKAQRKLKAKRMKNKTSDSKDKKAFIGIIIFSLLLPVFLPLQHDFGATKINGKRPLKIQYCFYLLMDAISGDTASVTINPKEFYVGKHSYSGRSRRSFIHYSRIYNYYAEFEGNCVYLYENEIEDYFLFCYEDNIDMEIEYYINSKVIKTINGIEIYDYYGFKNAVSHINTNP